MINLKRKLILEDGKIFEGEAFGASVNTAGTVIFHTGMTGYQEVFTDPAYCEHIVVMTSPTLGVYGLNREDLEAFTPFVSGVIAKEVAKEPSNFRSEASIDWYLNKYHIPGIQGIDTRMLTTYLRKHGVMKGYIVDNNVQTIEEARQLVMKDDTPVVQRTSKTRPYIVPGNGKRIVAIDLGLKQSMLRELMDRDFHIIVVPYHYTAEEVLQYRPEGVFISSGPGNAEEVTETIQTVKDLLGKVPILGTGLGHQILALAYGGKIKKLKVSQYGNHFPVKDLTKDKTWMTTKSSSFTVDEDSLQNLDVSITFRSLNEGLIEGMSHRKHPAISVQFHPEGAPGSNETTYVFDQFLELIENNIQKNGGFINA